MKNNNPSASLPSRKAHPFRDFLTATSSGMSMGLFATLIAGTIISTIALLFKNSGIEWVETIFEILTGLSTVLKLATGFGIGLGIAYALKLDGLKLISSALSGFIAAFLSKNIKDLTIDDGFVWTYSFGLKIGDPLTIFFVVILTLLLVNLIFKKKTPIDIILIPLATALIAAIITYVINQPVSYVTILIRTLFEKLSTLDNLFLMMLAGSLIAVIMGMCLTMPMISSAAVAIIFGIGNVSGAAALVGCSTQMVGFAVQSYRDNGFLKSLSVGVGTSMIQFKNIIKKPLIWLPTIITSALLGPFVVLLKYQASDLGAGMGTCGLVGQIDSVATMSEIGMPWWQTAIFIGVFQLILPFVLVFLFDLLFRKAKIIKKGDLTL